MNVCDHLKHLEGILLSHAVRRDPVQLSALLAAGFREIGSSGRSFSRSEILEELKAESAPIEVTLRDLECSMLSDTLALVTYCTVRTAPDGASATALRSSLWIFRDARWQIVFHQGTPVP